MQLKGLVQVLPVVQEALDSKVQEVQVLVQVLVQVQVHLNVQVQAQMRQLSLCQESEESAP